MMTRQRSTATGLVLCLDIGNSSTSAALFCDDERTPLCTFRYPTVKNEPPRDLGDRITDGLSEYRDCSASSISGIAFATVVPELSESYRIMANTVFGAEAYEVSSRSILNFTVGYRDPDQLGPDRIANAAAAFHEYGGGIIVVDLGTAVTFCVLLEGGIFDGGVIAPGAETSIRALATRASRLETVNFEKPDRVAARDTLNALKSGLYYGWISLVEGIIERLESEYGRRFRILLTGGHASIISPDMTREHIVDQLLALKGVRLIYAMNRRTT